MKFKSILLAALFIATIQGAASAGNFNSNSVSANHRLLTYQTSPSVTDDSGASTGTPDNTGTSTGKHHRKRSRKSNMSASDSTSMMATDDSTATTPVTTGRHHRRKSSVTPSEPDNMSPDASIDTPPSVDNPPVQTTTGKHHRRSKSNTAPTSLDQNPAPTMQTNPIAQPTPQKKMGFFARLKAARAAKAASASNGNSTPTPSNTRSNGFLGMGSGQIIGNKNTKVYHMPGDNNLPDEKNRVYFKSAADAEAAGYHASKSASHKN